MDDNIKQVTGLTGSDFFADALLHESIRESGTPYRFMANGNGINDTRRGRTEGDSDILSVYNSM